MIEVAERSFRSMDPREWDEFAAACGGSFMCASPVLRVARFTGRLRLMEFFRKHENGREKIGQCALRLRGREVRFLDRLLLLPEQTEAWSECMNAITTRLGARVYHYGSHWNEEPRCHPEFGPASGLERIWARTFQVDTVELSRWQNFDGYLRSVSDNIRRDMTRAQAAGSMVEVFVGWRALRILPTLLNARRHVMDKNKKPFSLATDAVIHVGKIILFGRRVLAVRASQGGQSLAALFCVHFGDSLYYVSGGILPNQRGIGSFMILNTIRSWMERKPRGRFVVGFATGTKSPSEYTEGDLLYRRKLRATGREGLEFTVRINPARKVRPVSSHMNIGATP